MHACMRNVSSMYVSSTTTGIQKCAVRCPPPPTSLSCARGVCVPAAPERLCGGECRPVGGCFLPSTYHICRHFWLGCPLAYFSTLERRVTSIKPRPTSSHGRQLLEHGDVLDGLETQAPGEMKSVRARGGGGGG